MKLKALGEILKQTGSDWLADNAPRMGAAIAFYAIFAIAPLLVICIAIAGLIFEHDTARGQLLKSLTDIIGPEGAAALDVMLTNAAQPQTGRWATIIGIATTVLAALGLFGELQADLNEVWNTKPRSDAGWWTFLRLRLVSGLMVLGSGLVLVGMLFASTAVAAIGSQLTILEPLLHWFVQILVLTVLFGLIYRVLPDAEILWHDVWLGAIITALLFSAGNYAIGIYLGRSAIGSAYGAAGSLAVLLAWFYYAAQVFLAGAEITQAYARRRGSGINPSPHADVADQRRRRNSHQMKVSEGDQPDA